MAFNDIVNNKIRNTQKLKKLDSYVEILENIVLNYNEIAYGLTKAFSNSIGNIMNVEYMDEVQKSREISKEIRRGINKIDIFELKDIIKEIKEENEEYKNMDPNFDNILEEFEGICRTIYSYLKLDDWDKKRRWKELLDEFKILIDNIVMYNFASAEIIGIQTCTEDKYELHNEEMEFNIQIS